MRHRPPTRILSAGLALTLLGAACSDDGDDEATPEETTTSAGDDATSTTQGGSEEPAGETLSEEDALAAATTYADVVVAAYDDNVVVATDLQTAIETFLAAPDAEGLATAQQAWVSARELYGPTEVFRFYDGPIDDPDDGPDDGPEGQINAWPMDEAYVDYTEDDPEAGLVNDPEALPEITAETIAGVNEKGGETNVSTGWHGIEILLWGQDLSDDGPGARPVTDYTDEPNAERRGQYLTALVELLVADLSGLRDEWDPEGGTYREEFLADPNQAVTNILRGMGALSAGELAGERMLVAYDTQDQEDEHSCFSDNTLADVAGNARGVQLAYLADDAGVEGTSLSEVVAGIDPDLDAELTEALAANLAAAEGLTDLGTFDQIIVDEASREELRTVAEGLQAQGDIVAEVTGALGYEISLGI